MSYRQFTRLLWDYLGRSKRYPLPCCAYNAIRKAFPSDDGWYWGFEEEEEEGGGGVEGEEDKHWNTYLSISFFYDNIITITKTLTWTMAVDWESQLWNVGNVCFNMENRI